jgi:hypothetical protein
MEEKVRANGGRFIKGVILIYVLPFESEKKFLCFNHSSLAVGKSSISIDQLKERREHVSTAQQQFNPSYFQLSIN